MQLTCRFLRVRFRIKHHRAYKLFILKYFYHLLSNTPFSLKVYYTGFFLLYTFVGLLSVHTLASVENFITWSKVSRSLATTALIPGDFTFYSSFYSSNLELFPSVSFDPLSVSFPSICVEPWPCHCPELLFLQNIKFRNPILLLHIQWSQSNKHTKRFSLPSHPHLKTHSWNTTHTDLSLIHTHTNTHI